VIGAAVSTSGAMRRASLSTAAGPALNDLRVDFLLG
jgi:hypothetical protein